MPLTVVNIGKSGPHKKENFLTLKVIEVGEVLNKWEMKIC